MDLQGTPKDGEQPAPRRLCTVKPLLATNTAKTSEAQRSETDSKPTREKDSEPREGARSREQLPLARNGSKHTAEETINTARNDRTRKEKEQWTDVL